MQQLSFRTILK